MAYPHGLEEQPGPLDEMMFMLTLMRESPRKVPKLVMAVVSAQLAEDEADPRLGLLDIGIFRLRCFCRAYAPTAAIQRRDQDETPTA
jgi:hypothetical protein